MVKLHLGNGEIGEEGSQCLRPLNAQYNVGLVDRQNKEGKGEDG